MSARWLGRGIDGKRRGKFVYAATEAEVVRHMKRLNGRAVDGHLLATTTPTIELYLVKALGPLRREQLSPAVVPHDRQSSIVDFRPTPPAVGCRTCML